MNRYRSALAGSPDGQWLAAGFSQGKVSVYRVPEDQGAVRPGFQALASPPGRGSDPGDLVVWDLETRH